MTVLALSDVQASFETAAGRFLALDGVSFSVEMGEFVSLVGRSGSGKSTLFNVSAGLLEPTAGRVTFEGSVVNGRPGHAGYMLQRDTLFPWRKLIDNVSLGRDVLGYDRRESRAASHGAAAEVRTGGVRSGLSVGAVGRHAPARCARCARFSSIATSCCWTNPSAPSTRSL